MEASFTEAWADVKMPGGFPDTAVGGMPATADNRFTYAVGNITVNTTIAAMFSGEPVFNAVPPFSLGAGMVRQIAIVQVSGGDTLNGTDTIQNQWFFHGNTPALGLNQDRSTNARAISVWEAPLAVNRRIAICGETYDEVVPQSQAPGGWAAATGAAPSGYIAVFDGNGVLLWTHHFFAGADPNAACMVTDLSIRVDPNGNDIVTYCGMFTHGDPGAGSSLSPVNPFPAAAPCSGGATVQAAGQWDGFVGRLQRPFAGPTATQFHSFVCSEFQDGLFGLAELDENRFAVVGSTDVPAGLNTDFPDTLLCSSIGPLNVAPVMVFDASGPALAIEGACFLGGNAGNNTIARDVAVGRGADVASGTPADVIYVVGSTDVATETQMSPFIPFAKMAPAGFDVNQGGVDGYIAAVSPNPGVCLPLTMSFHGTPNTDGLTGVQGWNEYPEHVSVVGFTNGAGAGGFDIDVASYYYNNSFGPGSPGTFNGPPNGSEQLLRMRQDVVGGVSEDLPTVMGAQNATTVGLPFNLVGIGHPSGENGGGVTVGENGRTCVAGRTNPTGGYPVVGGAARGPDVGADAVRTEIDLLPDAVGGLLGAGRTDGTGFQTAPATWPPVLATGWTGGTTPFCAQNEYGDRIGQPSPVNGLRRMLIDFEGDMVAGSTNSAIVVSQPNPVAGTVMLGVLQFGFPPTVPWAYLTGTEIWLGGGMYSPFPSTTGVRASYRMPLNTLTGAGPISAQMVCFLATPVVGPGAGCSSLYTSSPVLWFNY